MHSRFLRFVVPVLFCLLWLIGQGQTIRDTHQKHTLVAMRMIGHQVLLSSGDYLSRVLPIEQEGDGYRIRFGADFALDPDQLVTTVDSVMRLTHIAKGYVLEVEQCETNQVAYSYVINDAIGPHEVACKSRMLPIGCYSILITLTDPDPTLAQLDNTSALSPTLLATQGANMLWPALLALIAMGCIGLFMVLRKKKQAPMPKPSANTIAIGHYQFDARNMALWHNTTKDELTSKEADLLALLHASVNTTVERDVLLKKVWGDEGAYVGRTLDVFISKLRKKLESDPNVRIVNVRGIGYKLILGGEEE